MDAEEWSALGMGDALNEEAETATDEKCETAVIEMGLYYGSER